MPAGLGGEVVDLALVFEDEETYEEGGELVEGDGGLLERYGMGLVVQHQSDLLDESKDGRWGEGLWTGLIQYSDCLYQRRKCGFCIFKTMYEYGSYPYHQETPLRVQRKRISHTLKSCGKHDALKYLD